VYMYHICSTHSRVDGRISCFHCFLLLWIQLQEYRCAYVSTTWSHFLWKWGWIFFHIPIGHLYIFFWEILILIYCLFIYFCGSGHWTQSLMHARKTLYHCTSSPAPIVQFWIWLFGFVWFVCLFGFLLLSFWSSLCILDSNHLSNVYFANMFFHCVGFFLHPICCCLCYAEAF
jgi:hypothetical protein